MFHSMKKWVTELDDVRHLRWLDDRLLADIGVARGNIGRAVRGGIHHAAEDSPDSTNQACAATARAAVAAVATRREPAR